MHINESFAVCCPGASIRFEQIEAQRIRAVVYSAIGDEITAVIVGGNLRDPGYQAKARNKAMSAAVRASETETEHLAREVRAGILAGRYSYKLDNQLTDALEERALFECAAGNVAHPYAYAYALCRNVAVQAFRDRQRDERRAARAIADTRVAREKAAVEKLRLAVEAELLNEYVARAQALEGNDAMHAKILRARKFEQVTQAEEQRRFGGSRAARDQWVSRGRKRLVALGISRELEAFLRVRSPQ